MTADFGPPRTGFDDGAALAALRALRAGPVPQRVAALVATLTALADASDAVGMAVRRHDHAALLDANLRADALTDQVAAQSAALTDQERAAFETAGVAAVCERLRVSARRNAYLIERAWAIDAATMRLLAGLGRIDQDGAVSAFAATAPDAACVDRQA